MNEPRSRRTARLRPLCGMRIALLEGRAVDAVRLERLYASFEHAGAEVRIVAPELDLELDDSTALRADERLSDAAPERYHALCVPGSAAATSELVSSPRARELVADFDASGKWIAAFDHAPLLLACSVGVGGRKLTSAPALEGHLTNAGAIWLPDPVVVDRTWLSARGSRLANALEIAAGCMRKKAIEPPPSFVAVRSASRF